MPFRPRSDPSRAPTEHAHYPAYLLHLAEVCQQIHADTKLLIFSGKGVSGHPGHVFRFLGSGSLTIDQKCAIRTINYRILEVLLPCEVGIARPNGQPHRSFTYCLKRLFELKGLQKIVITSLLRESDTLATDPVEIQEKARKLIKDEGLNVNVDFEVESIEQSKG